ncbi:MAG TPA: TIGR01777 family oxidoreductase [Candidatus Sulfotelmatobacter sp.]|jgi:uncharacterized protein (TIGR01777 family)|nr:TIGR01777 family oxidoreductase [Candidatus Sulfotelmatobacter sp.]
MASFVARSAMPVEALELDRWHERPGSFERLIPPWSRVAILERTRGLDVGGRIVLRIGRFPLSVLWTAEHTARDRGRRFVDTQVSGPFARWVHEHVFEDAGGGTSVLSDRVDYALPAGGVGAVLGGKRIRRALDRAFTHRHRVTREDLSRHAPFLTAPPLRVAVTGATGLVGSALCAFLLAGGHEVIRLVRGRPAATGEAAWDPLRGTIDRDRLEGLDAVVHLAGENIASGRWTRRRKARILASRTLGTELIVRTLAALAHPPETLVSASAIGIYGATGRLVVDESSPPGTGFLSEVSRAWEAAAAPAAAAGIRVVALRLGIVLSPRGGALGKMLPAFRLALGGPIGSGGQGFSWVALDDAVYAIHHVIRSRGVAGPVNVVAPEPVGQREFARALGIALGRPALFPLPRAMVWAVFGQLGEETLLASPYVSPGVLARSGFVWSAPELDAALASLLGS